MTITGFYGPPPDLQEEEKGDLTISLPEGWRNTISEEQAKKIGDELNKYAAQLFWDVLKRNIRK